MALSTAASVVVPSMGMMASRLAAVDSRGHHSTELEPGLVRHDSYTLQSITADGEFMVRVIPPTLSPPQEKSTISVKTISDESMPRRLSGGAAGRY